MLQGCNTSYQLHDLSLFASKIDHEDMTIVQSFICSEPQCCSLERTMMTSNPMSRVREASVKQPEMEGITIVITFHC